MHIEKCNVFSCRDINKLSICFFVNIQNIGIPKPEKKYYLCTILKRVKINNSVIYECNYKNRHTARR